MPDETPTEELDRLRRELAELKAMLPNYDSGGDTKQQALAWSCVWKALEDAGLYQRLFSLDDNGMQRAVKFVGWMKAENARLRRDLERIAEQACNGEGGVKEYEELLGWISRYARESLEGKT